MWKDVPYVILSILIALVLLSLHFPAQGGELGAGARATSQIEAGFTSNGTDSGIGEPDTFVRQVHVLEIGSETPELALRGSVRFEDMRFRVQQIENDQSLGVSLAVGRQVTPELLLRGAVSAQVSDVGDDWNFLGFYIATRTPSIAAEGSAEAVWRAGGTEIKARAELGGHRYGDASFPTLPLEPMKLQADDTRYRGQVSVRQALGAVVGLAEVEGEIVDIPERDQVDLGRLPGRRLRGSLGGELGWGSVTVSAEGGGEVVWADERQLLLPYARLRLALAVTDSLSLEAVVGERVELVDNLDAAGSHDRRLSVGLRYALQPEFAVLASAERVMRVGLIDPTMTSDETVLALAFERSLNAHFAYRAKVSHTSHVDTIETYEKTEFVLGVTGTI